MTAAGARSAQGRPSFLFRLGWFLASPVIRARRALGRARARLRPARSRVRHRWSPGEASALAPLVWTNARIVREYLHVRASGNPGCDWVTWMLSRYSRDSRQSALVLGGGEGWLERVLARDPRIAKVMGVDIARESVEEAARLAEAEGLSALISHEVVDLDRDEIPGGPYDLVLAHDAIHHVRDLEGLFERIARALAPGGTLLFCEYVGPSRFDFDERRQAQLDHALRSLPEKYRRLQGRRGLATKGHRTDPAELAIRDPSEAVRSDEILPVLRNSMTVLEEIPYGGGLLAPLLFELILNFEDGNPADDAVLRSLCDRERALMESGELGSDYVVVAARKRADGGNPP
ncbi:MAG: class I SAM-dependent methyltransferase [Acidobacteria bacterium]|nr:class I SAM-dependent methyltransferase [Acidobacteriota bacterium]MCA1610006.1 class I SAM-dependent methyltransferase [Acidobacteriota bacterium]